jgi:NAD(P)-dependent dehydrogenase (short-subunit alcohol dehydrogenase family)
MGRGICSCLLREGADLVISDLDLNAAERVAEEGRKGGGRGLSVKSDVTSEADCRALIDRALEEFGRIDILVNNAAYARGPDRVPLLELDPVILQKVVDVKIRGTFLCSKAVARVLIHQGEGGKIVNISSGAGKSGGVNALAYNAACFAQVGMTQSLAKELGPYKINVNCVCPGAVDTSRVDDVGRGVAWEEIERNTPIGRAGTDEEVGAIIAHLCTEATSWITGQSINVDGGGIMEH